jgi:Fe-S cluster biosynthesis and repair protein YggX
MSRTIYCVKSKQSAFGLDAPPYPGELGQRIYDSISQTVWQQWIQRQTMLINEYRLSTLDAQARDFLKTEMEQFLFGHTDSTGAADSTPPSNSNNTHEENPS